MPPMKTGKVDFPEDWELLFGLRRQIRSEPLVLGGLSVFDGLPRSSRRISEALAAKGLVTASIDIRNPTDDPSAQNILEEAGLTMFLEHLASLEKDSILWLAPPCKSWSFLPRSVSRRSKANPHGASSAWVDLGNQHAKFVEQALLAATSQGTAEMVR